MSWLELLLEAALVVLVITGLGIGPAAWLAPGRRFPWYALAPAYGLAVGAVLLTTAADMMTMRRAAWAVLLPALLVSIGAAVVAWSRGRVGSGRRWRTAPWLVASVLAALLIAGLPLASRDSTGPLGYVVNDATGGYPAQEMGLRSNTLGERGDWGPDWDFSAAFAERWGAKGFQQVGYDAVEASIQVSFGWRSTDTQSAFLIALVVIGAAGAFAAGVGLTRGPGWVGALAALFYAGPLTMQLTIDGSQAALSGLALIGPLALAGAWFIESRTRIPFIAAAVLGAGLQTLYPLIFPTIVLAAAFLAAVPVVRAARRGLRGVPRALWTSYGPLAALLLCALLVSPVALERNLRYWSAVIGNDFLGGLAAIFPQYGLPFPRVVTWLAQVRAFPYFTDTSSAVGAQEILVSLVVLVLIGGLVVVGMIRFPRARVLLAIGVAATLLATVAYRGEGCVYCMQRNLVVLGPVIGLGLVAGLLTLSRRGVWGRGAAVAGALMLVGTGAAGAATIVRRADDGGYALPATATRTIDALEGRRGAVMLEGANASYLAVHELTALYYALRERTAGPIWLDDAYDDHQGLWTFGPNTTPAVTFRGGYRWVLTRLPSIETQRATIARHGAYALQRRLASADVTVLSGVAADASTGEAGGRAWVEGPLVFRVSTLAPQQAALVVRLRTAGPLRALDPPSARLRRVAGDTWEACVPLGVVRGRRDVALGLGFPSDGPLAQTSRLALRPEPAHDVELAAMRVGARC
jgi:hypothetical protein